MDSEESVTGQKRLSEPSFNNSFNQSTLFNTTNDSFQSYHKKCLKGKQKTSHDLASISMVDSSPGSVSLISDGSFLSSNNSTYRPFRKNTFSSDQNQDSLTKIKEEKFSLEKTSKNQTKQKKSLIKNFVNYSKKIGGKCKNFIMNISKQNNNKKKKIIAKEVLKKE